MSDKGGPIEYISNDAYKHQSITRCRRGRDLIVVGFTTTYAISALTLSPNHVNKPLNDIN